MPKFLPAIIVWIIVSALLLYRITPENVFYGDDVATSLAAASAMLRGESVLLGPPSHLGGRHLGPVYYWHNALCLWLSGGDTFGALVWDIRIKLIGVLITLCTLVLFLQGRALLVGTFFAGFSMLAGEIPAVVRLPWHSNFLLLPCSLVFLTAILSIQRGGYWFAAFIVSASLALQTHFSSLPLIAALGLLTLYGLWSRREKENFLWLGCISGFVFLLSAIAPLLYEMRQPSNIARLFGVHGHGEKARAGVGDAVKIMSEFFTRNLGMGELPGATGLLQLFVPALLALGIFYALRKKSSEEKLSLAVLLFPWFFYLVFLALLHPPVLHFYLLALSGAVPLLAGIGFAALGASPARALLSYICLGLCAIIFVFSASKNFLSYTGTPYAVYNTVPHAEEITRLIKADSRGRPARIITRGKYNHREGTFYYLLGQEWNPLFYYASSFKEVPSFRRKLRKQIATGYVLSCDGENRPRKDVIPKKLAARWRVDQEVALESCPSCVGCRLTKIRRVLTSESAMPIPDDKDGPGPALK